MKILLKSESNFENKLHQLLSDRLATNNKCSQKVKNIINDVKTHGDRVLIKLNKELDGHMRPLAINDEEIQNAYNKSPPSLIKALKHSIKRITYFHKLQSPTDYSTRDAIGVYMGWKWQAIQSVGIYVPGGKACYPSSLIMNVVPAQIAGVKNIFVVSPGQKEEDNLSFLVAAKLLGLSNLFRLGGAQAIAALTFGTKTIPKVNKIYGPGNSWVVEAKRQLFGRVGIDSIAGPSEILILADKKQDANIIAADAIAQAEHDTTCQSIIITETVEFAKIIKNTILDQLETLNRSETAKKSIKNHGGIIVISKVEEAIPIIEQIAPEHLQICWSEKVAYEITKSICNVGSIFIGSHTPEVFADYIAGPNHTLPTFGTAKFASGLSVADFMRRTTFLETPNKAYKYIADDCIQLANSEGLPAHAYSILIRNKN